MKIFGSLVLCVAIVGLWFACGKDDSGDADSKKSGWANTTCTGTDACIDVTQSSEGGSDPSCSKFSYTEVGEDSCKTGCVGHCKDVKGGYFTFTKYYYGPTYSEATAKTDCEADATESGGTTPFNGTAGTFVAGC